MNIIHYTWSKFSLTCMCIFSFIVPEPTLPTKFSLNLNPGDHIYSGKTVHNQHAIYIGEKDCEVIHFGGNDTGNLENNVVGTSTIRKTTLKKLCGENAPSIVKYNCAPSEKVFSFLHSDSSHTVEAMPLPETIKLAKHFLDHPEEWSKYHLVDNNSEAFACFCKTGLMDIAAQLHPLNWFGDWSKEKPCTTCEEALRRKQATSTN